MMLQRTPPSEQGNSNRRAFWLRQLRQWHWISAAVSLLGILLFAVTGITLNHAAQIETKPETTVQELRLPQALHDEVRQGEPAANAPLPSSLDAWLGQTLGVSAGDRPAEWSDDEIYLALPQPGGDAWISIDRQSGELRHEATNRGWISYLNDLHKGRNTGFAWSLFIDVFAIACILFSLTGLLLLQLYSANRPMTWPLVGLGCAIPILIAILLIH